MNVARLERDYAALVEGVVRRIRSLGLLMRAIFADPEHFNLAVISTSFELGSALISSWRRRLTSE